MYLTSITTATFFSARVVANVEDEVIIIYIRRYLDKNVGLIANQESNVATYSIDNRLGMMGEN